MMWTGTPSRVICSRTVSRVVPAMSVTMARSLPDGKFTSEVPPYAGQLVFDANAPISRDLRSAGRLLRHETIEHSYPHSWRSKAPVIFRNTPQWFIRMDEPLKSGDTLRETALQAIDEGVRAVVILDGRVPHASLLELFTEQGAGSLIRSTEPRVKPHGLRQGDSGL